MTSMKNVVKILAEQICIVKTSGRSQMNPKKVLYKIAFSV